MAEEHPANQVSMRALLRSLPVFTGELPVFDAGATPADPVSLFTAWLASAADSEVPEPHAMTLSTVDAHGQPSARVLICREVDSTGRWYFASSATSRKGRELDANPHAALTFYWPAQGRQIRIRGAVAPTGAERSAADFLARSPASRAESLTGRQSDILDYPAEADAALEAASAAIAAEPGLVAPDWTLYALTAADAEFWQADEHRRHTRLRYERADPGWIRHLLWP
jgi:pyridoxamine 5'-phosphate oxidase